MYRSASFLADAPNGSRCWYHSPPSRGILVFPGLSYAPVPVHPSILPGNAVSLHWSHDYPYKRHPAGTLTPRLDIDILFVLNGTPHFLATLVMPICREKLMEKEQGQTVLPIAPQGLSDWSLLCHKGTRSPRWRSRTAWISRRSPVCWGTTTRVSPYAPTHTPPGRCRTRRRKPWGASWRR